MPMRISAGFGTYLRRHRALIAHPGKPTDGPDARRRVPGLRRQEPAEAAGISVEYYTRLEQDRAPRPSREVLTALAQAFGLSAAGRDHWIVNCSPAGVVDRPRRQTGHFERDPGAFEVMVRPAAIRAQHRPGP